MPPVAAKLDHASYFDPAWFEAEQRALARSWWLCSGLAAFSGESLPAQWGGLSFTRQVAGGQTLAAQLAPFGDWLAEATRRVATPERAGRIEIACNWKLLVENTLDDCHGGTLHARSLQRSFPQWRTAFLCERHAANSAIEHALSDADIAFWSKVTRRLRIARFGDGERYRHVFFFPNLYVSTFFDALVIVHRVLPLGPERSALEWSLALPLGEPPTVARTAVYKAVLDDLVAKAEAVIAEDLAICRLAQSGRAYAVHPGVFGARELRAADFQEVLIETMRRQPRHENASIIP